MTTNNSDTQLLADTIADIFIYFFPIWMIALGVELLFPGHQFFAVCCLVLGIRLIAVKLLTHAANT